MNFRETSSILEEERIRLQVAKDLNRELSEKGDFMETLNDSTLSIDVNVEDLKQRYAQVSYIMLFSKITMSKCPNFIIQKL